MKTLELNDKRKEIGNKKVPFIDMLSVVESVYGTSFFFFFLILLRSALKLGISKLIFQVESAPNNLWNMKTSMSQM